MTKDIDCTLIIDFGDNEIIELKIDDAKILQKKLNEILGRDPYIPWFPEIPNPLGPVITYGDSTL